MYLLYQPSFYNTTSVFFKHDRSNNDTADGADGGAETRHDTAGNQQ